MSVCAFALASQIDGGKQIHGGISNISVEVLKEETNTKMNNKTSNLVTSGWERNYRNQDVTPRVQQQKHWHKTI